MPDLVEQYRGEICRYTEAILRPYIETMKAAPASKLSIKEINDTVWQTIYLFPLEIRVLDSPLLQRLRRIRQLGVVHWTYPSAGHSRLEHSIGAVHQLQRLFDSLSKRSLLNAPLGSELLNVLRLAALCHDIGHGLMSHVVENAFKALGTIDDLSFALADFLDKEDVQLSEVAAYFMVGSPAFVEMINVLRERYKHPLPNEFSSMIQNAIVGKIIDHRFPIIQELISGPFDCDKLDYMTRDAHMSGIPVVTDIPRLLQKIRLVEIEKNKLPQEVARTVEGDFPSYYMQAVSLSGARTLDELMLGRTLLFDKVYRHQKVRAAEALVGTIVAELVSLLPQERAALLPLFLDDDDLLDLSEEQISKKLQISVSKETWDGLQPARDLGQRLRNRNLFVRAYAFSHSMPHDPFRDEPSQKRGIERLRRDAAKPESRTELINDIVIEIRRIRALADEPIAPSISDEQLRYYIALDPPSSHGGTSEIARAYLVTGNGELLKFRDDSAESPAWSNAYVMTRDLGYIFAASELATAAFLAAEIVFRRKFDIRTPPGALYYAKVDEKLLKQLRVTLTTKNYFDDKPNDLRAQPARLAKIDVAPRITKIAQSLGAFEGLSGSDPKAPTAVRVDASRIYTWLRQFRTDEEIESALRVLEAIRLITRTEIHAAVEWFVGKHEEFKGAFVCPIGSPKDSSSLLTYYVHDLAEKYGFTLATINDALLSNESRPILFVDDFVGTGNQSCKILATWAGKPELVPLNEDHGPPLATELQQKLLQRKLGFLFVAGETAGAKALKELSDKLPADVTADVHLTSESLPRAFDGTAVKYDDKGTHERFKDRCGVVGAQLLRRYGDKDRSPEWIADKILGYGNKGYLVVFPYNTPTQTLTLLWCEGVVDGWNWLPLLPRRKKV